MQLRRRLDHLGLNKGSPLFVFMASLSLGCAVELAPGAGTLVTCGSDADCPPESTCRVAIGRCITTGEAEADRNPPGVAELLLAPDRLGPGDACDITVTLDEPLGVLPAAELIFAEGAVPLTLASSDRAAHRYIFSFAASEPLVEGASTLSMDLIDVLGNGATVTRPGPTVDGTGPLVSNLAWAVGSGAVVPPDAELDFSWTSEAGATLVTVSLRDDTNALVADLGAITNRVETPAGTTFSGSVDLRLLTLAGHAVLHLEVTLRDDLDNQSDATLSAAVEVDNAAPTVTFDANLPLSTANTAASLDFVADEPATFECSLDGAPLSVCTPPLQVGDVPPGLAIGTHSLAVIATDSVGNRASVAATFTWQVLRVFEQIDAGGDHTCAIANDRSLWCWGSGANGALGGGNTVDSAIPQRVGTGRNWLSLSVGVDGGCAVDTDQQPHCWGTPLGVADTIAFAPTAIDPAHPYSHAELGERVGCALRQDGTLACWGDNEYGALGLGVMSGTVPTPVQIEDFGGVVQVGIGVQNVCARNTSGEIFCWGRNSSGELGQGNFMSGIVSPSPIDCFGCAPFFDLSVGDRLACGLAATSPDPTLYCWGNYYPNYNGAPSPTVVATGDFVDLEINTDLLCVRGSDDEIRCKGLDHYGQLGDGVPDDGVSTFTSIGMSNIRQFSLGAGHVCGLDDAGGVRCTGLTGRGQLGNGLAAITPTAPFRVPGSPVSDAVDTYGGRTCSILDGVLACTGANQHGELGLGHRGWQSSLSPVAIAARVSMVSTSLSTTCAVANSELFCFGDNSRNGLARATTGTQATEPLANTTHTDWARVATGPYSACGVRGPNNSLMCWGAASPGADLFAAPLGVASPCGSAGCLNTTLATDATRVAVAADFACAIREGSVGSSSGSVWCWGRGAGGRLGRGAEGGIGCAAQTDDAIPALVTSPTGTVVNGWVDVVVAAETPNGPGHACALEVSTSGSQYRRLWCWGDNDGGQLGQAPSQSCFDDPRLMPYEDWQSVAVAPGATCGIRADSTLWCWGRNDARRLFPDRPLRPEITTPTNVGGTGWTSVRMSVDNTCATRNVDDGAGPESHTYCWGSGATGALGDRRSLSATPVEVLIPQ